MTYYSQNGEDIILDELFKGQEKGYFVEVGCIDGRRFSNTLFFEEKGWGGMCVEAHSGYIELLNKNRPGSLICHCAAGEKDETTIFYANNRGSLSTLDKTKENLWKKGYADYFSGFEEQSVKKVRLSGLFESFDVKEIDFLSLDIEGYEVEAIQGLNLSKHKPKVILIESDSLWHEAKLNHYLCKFGYVNALKAHGNVFYFGDLALSEIVRGKVYRGLVTHTQHPLDSDGDKVVEVEIDARKPNRMMDSILLKLYQFIFSMFQLLKFASTKKRHI